MPKKKVSKTELDKVALVLERFVFDAYLTGKSRANVTATIQTVKRAAARRN